MALPVAGRIKVVVTGARGSLSAEAIEAIEGYTQDARNSAEDAAMSADEAQAAATQAVSGGDVFSAPSDAVALWAMNRYDNSNRFVPNIVAPDQAAPDNLKRGAKRSLNSLFWDRNNVVATDNAAVGTSGNTDSSTIVATGNWLLMFGDNSGNIPAGTYTIALTAKRGGSTNQQFAFTYDRGATRASVSTATATFQRFVYTFTLASPTSNFFIGLCSSDGTANANLVIDKGAIEFFSGSSDLGPSEDYGHILIGKSHAASPPSFMNGAISGAGVVGSVHLPSRFTYKKWSHVALVEQSAITANPWVLSDINSFNNWNAQLPAASVTPTGSPMSAISGEIMYNRVAAQNGQGQRGGYVNLPGKNYHMLTRTYDGVAEELWLDDVRMFRYERTLTARNLQDFLAFGDVNGTAVPASIAGLMGLWDRALSYDEIRNLFSYQRARSPQLAIPGLRSLRVLAIEGDSNHGGYDQFSWPWQYQAFDNPENFGTLWSTSGSRLNHATDSEPSLANAPAMVDRAARLDAVIPPNTYDRTFNLTIGIGTNDLSLYPGATDEAAAVAYETELKAYCMSRRAAGWRILLFTLQPRDSGNTVFNRRRAFVNTIRRADWAQYGLIRSADIIDIAADNRIGTDTSVTDNPGNFVDGGLHFSQAGAAIVASIAAPVIDAAF